MQGQNEVSDKITQGLQKAHCALLIGVYRSGGDKEACQSSLNELHRLCDTLGLSVKAELICPIKKLESATYVGSGKVEEIELQVKAEGMDVVIFDEEISPHQQRNLEEALKVAVVDRTELIIEVFAKHAKTKEARLQVELAKVRYQMPRLKRLWTHLSRQSAGGGAHLKGEGEKQIEIDRRILKRRIDQLGKEIEEIKEHRGVQRNARLRSGIPTFAIVGYTNSGKSTLLNALTQAGVLAEDKLFATLDTTTRKFQLPNKQEILLVDTVGFIQKIPHTLIAAFRSTLEEVIHTDILLHMIDISNPDAEKQAEETNRVLKELGAENMPTITVLNKVDAAPSSLMMTKMRIKYPKTVPISALTGIGFDHLLEMMVKGVSKLRKVYSLRIPLAHYKLISEIMREGRVISSEYEENDALLKVEIPAELEYKFRSFMCDGN